MSSILLPKLLRNLVAAETSTREAHTDCEIHAERSGTDDANDSHENVLNSVNLTKQVRGVYWLG
jgi:hypothetical protein